MSMAKQFRVSILTPDLFSCLQRAKYGHDHHHHWACQCMHATPTHKCHTNTLKNDYSYSLENSAHRPKGVAWPIQSFHVHGRRGVWPQRMDVSGGGGMAREEGKYWGEWCLNALSHQVHTILLQKQNTGRRVKVCCKEKQKLCFSACVCGSMTATYHKALCRMLQDHALTILGRATLAAIRSATSINSPTYPVCYTTRGYSVRPVTSIYSPTCSITASGSC